MVIKEKSLPTGMNSAGKINDEILKMEFGRLYGLFEKREEFGEKRTTLMIIIDGYKEAIKLIKTFYVSEAPALKQYLYLPEPFV